MGGTDCNWLTKTLTSRAHTIYIAQKNPQNKIVTLGSVNTEIVYFNFKLRPTGPIGNKSYICKLQNLGYMLASKLKRDFQKNFGFGLDETLA